MRLTEVQIRVLREAAANLEKTMGKLKDIDPDMIDTIRRELEHAQPHLRKVQRISSVAVPSPFFGTKIRETLEALRGE